MTDDPKPAADQTPAPEQKPEPALKIPAGPPARTRAHDDPTRYGDWEVGGRCIDF